MDNFFQTLRDIQKKERATGTLSEIDESFYDDASKYLQELLKIVNDNPLSLEAYQLRDAQRITIEICERREVKIITTAITNVQKSHNLFKGHEKNSQLYDEIPYNTTPEEEKLYRDMIDTFIHHRENLMNEITPQKKKTNKIGFKPIKDDDSQEISEFEEANNSKDMAVNDASQDHIPDDSINSQDNLMDIAQPSVDNTISSSHTKAQVHNKLDANQVTMMFGKAPDDVLMDEQNNPVREKSVKTGDMMAPFEPPTVPKDDTIALQNNKKDLEEANLTDEIPQKEVTGDTSVGSDSSNQPEGEILTDNGVQEAKSQEQSDVAEDTLADEVLVEFTDIISTDILDENEKTYGPFEIQDVALLPKSIVKILKNNDVINIIE